MRESYGGTMLFYIVLFFMSIFIAFLASVIKYARIYKMKNSMINYIERQEGVTGPEEVSAELLSIGYPSSSYFDICMYKPREDIAYYYIKLNATFSLPIVSYAFDVPIKGETRMIETGVTINSKNTAFSQSNCFYDCRASDGHCGSTSNDED